MHQPVLVTGASSGIGEATAVFLAHRGFKVFAAARRLDKLKTLAGLAEGRIHPIEMDVTSDASVEDALGDIAAQSGPLYGLVNNAGVNVMGPVESNAIDDWRRQYETNVYGLVRVTQAFLPQMRAAGRGRIVNIGSVAGRIAVPFQGVYASSKHAVEGLSDALRRELRPHGVKVSVIRPGFINTPFGEQEQASLSRFLNEDTYKEQIKRFKAWHVKGHPNAPPPTTVAELAHQALTAERPKAYYVTPSAMKRLLALRNLLPTAVIDRMLDRVIGLEKTEKRSDASASPMKDYGGEPT